jgi:hypothetical protein
MTHRINIIMCECMPLMVYWMLFYATHFKTWGPSGKWKTKNFGENKMIEKFRDFGFGFCHYTKIDVVNFLCSPVEIQKFTWQDFRWVLCKSSIRKMRIECCKMASVMAIKCAFLFEGRQGLWTNRVSEEIFVRGLNWTLLKTRLYNEYGQYLTKLVVQ